MKILTWANLLTVFRLAIALPCASAVINQRWTLAALLFVLAVLSDLFDGVVARKRMETSALGGLLDHSTDAAFVTLGLSAFVVLNWVSLLLPILIALSFLQYMLDSNVLRGKHLRMSFLGRWNGIGYFVLLGVGIFSPLLIQLWPGWPGLIIIQGFAWLLITSTLVSMADRGLTLLRG